MRLEISYPLPVKDMTHSHFLEMVNELKGLRVTMIMLADTTNISYRRLKYLRAGERKYRETPDFPGYSKIMVMTFPEQVVIQNVLTSTREMRDMKAGRGTD